MKPTVSLILHIAASAPEDILEQIGRALRESGVVAQQLVWTQIAPKDEARVLVAVESGRADVRQLILKLSQLPSTEVRTFEDVYPLEALVSKKHPRG